LRRRVGRGFIAPQPVSLAAAWRGFIAPKRAVVLRRLRRAEAAPYEV